MNIEKRYNIVLHLNDTEIVQLLEGLRYIRHRFANHYSCGIHKANCKSEFVNNLIQLLENTNVQTHP